jgi:hypothetical protein
MGSAQTSLTPGAIESFACMSVAVQIVLMESAIIEVMEDL